MKAVRDAFDGWAWHIADPASRDLVEAKVRESGLRMMSAEVQREWQLALGEWTDERD